MNLSRKILSLLIFILLFTLPKAFIFSQNSDTPASVPIKKDLLPQIEKLKTSRANVAFSEYNKIVEDNNIEIYAKRKPDMLFFVHTMTQADKTDLHWGDSQLISLASRCNISYDTIATLNKIRNSTDNLIGQTLILPTASGLFIKRYADKNANALEILLREHYADTTLTDQDYYFNIDGEEYIFLLGKRFSSTERFYFLDSYLGLPLEKGTFWISSEFGKRKNPVNGEWKNHNGIDLAAAEGTPVYAIKDGNAAFCIKNDKTFGNYIILSHDTGKMTSVYAHLSSICINQYQFVRKGDIIGYVGHTGMATGDHLHFEIRQGGVAKNPQEQIEDLH